MKGSRPISRLQCKAIISSAVSIREKTLLMLGFCCGYRISELLSLRVGDVSTGGVVHSHATVKASNSKTKVGRTVLLNSDAKKAIAALLAVIGIDSTTPLFISRKRAVTGELKAISRQQAHEVLKALFAKIGEFGNVSSHTLRKTFAARVWEATKQLPLVQQALGHKSLNSTASYIDFGSDEVNSAIMGIM